MKVSKKEVIFSLLLCLAPILLGLVYWNALPELVPTHFNLQNEPDGWSSKTFAVLGLPALLAAIELVCLLGTSRDPRAERQSAALQRIALWTPSALSCMLMPLIIYTALGRTVNIALYVQLLLGVLFVLVGNYLPKCRQNATMGIRLPWTLADEENWNYTHRIGGFCWVAAGAVMLVNAFVGSVWVLFAVIAAAVLLPTAASYHYYRSHR